MSGLSRRAFFGLMAGASALPFMPVSAPLVVGVDLASEPSRTIAARWVVESTQGAGGSWVYRFFVDDEAPAEFVWLLDPSPPAASETKTNDPPTE